MPKSALNTKLLTLCGAVLLVVAIAGCGGGEPDSSPTTYPGPATATTATAPALPTNTAQPLATDTTAPAATSPAATPPAPMATGTATPNTARDDGSAAYLAQAQDLYTRYNNLKIDFGSYIGLWSTHGKSFEIMHNQLWVVRMTTDLTKYQQLGQTVDALVAPNSQQQIQSELNSMADIYNEMARSYHDGFYNQDRALVDEGTRYRQLGDDTLRKLHTLLYPESK